VADVPAGQAAFTDMSTSLPTSGVYYDVTAVDSSGLRSVPAGEFNIVGWRSVRMHDPGAPGDDLSIVLNSDADGGTGNAPTVETREGGIQKIELDFDSAVTLTTTPEVGITISAGTDTYAPTSVTPVDGDTIAIHFDPGVLLDQKCYTITIGPGTVTQTIAGDNDCMIRSLMGDTTGNGAVNLGDVLLTRTKLTQPATDNPQHDIDLSGAIDSSDMQQIKSAVTTPPNQALCP
jgi:hypothetical protein